MNIFNRPPAISEDSLQFFIHLGPISSNRYDALALATRFKSHASNMLPGHMWHRDSFELNVSVDERGKYNLDGVMRVGDSVDDEWCAVWLLKDISRQWDVAIRTFDSDGEFLLIEAADTLPDWLTPENAENRVWIYQGRLHIIPLEYSSLSGSGKTRPKDDEDVENDEVDTINLLEAVEIIRNPNINTLAAFDIEHAALERTKKYPEAARQHIHHTKAYVPREIAMALLGSPELVQKAVETFYTRDALQMRAAARMAKFSPVDSVLATVKLTRTAYAQLMSQKFYPPRSFGVWTDPEGSTERRRKDIGMKIACGFEMLYQESKGQNQSTHKEDVATAQTLKNDPHYQQYITRLREMGFFNTANSEQLERLEIQCMADYVRDTSSGESARLSFRRQVDAAIERIQSRMNAGEKMSFLDEEEDPDQWLSDAEHVFEDMISKQATIDSNETLATDEDTLASKQATHLRQLANEVEKFVEGEGDVEGALFADDPDISEEDSDDENITGRVKEVDTLNPQENTVSKSLVPPLDPSDYGKMPASYYDSSQKVKELVPEAHNSENIDVSSDISSNKPTNDSKEVRFIRPLLFPRDRFDGVEDSDDESETGAEEDEEEKPALVGELEVDMNDEQEEFIEFSREILGITPDLWSSIIKERQDRGVFVPNSVSTIKESRKLKEIPSSSPLKKEEQETQENSKLNSFEAVMDALDVELHRIKEEKGGPKGKGIANPDFVEAQGETTENFDIDEEMANELKVMMQENGNAENMDYTLIKNFLESFKSQQGLSGPVSNLIGRMGWQLPRDTS